MLWIWLQNSKIQTYKNITKQITSPYYGLESVLIHIACSTSQSATSKTPLNATSSRIPIPNSTLSTPSQIGTSHSPSSTDLPSLPEFQSRP